MNPVPDLLRRAARAVAERSGAARLELHDKREEGAGRGVDLVTECDLRVDRLVTRGLAEHFPGVAVISEEGARPSSTPVRGDAFVLDPIDGTHNFAAGVPWWGISLGRVEAGELAEGWLLESGTGRLFHATADGPATVDGAPLSVSARAPAYALASVGLSHAVVPLLLAADRFAGVRAMGCASLGLAWAAEGRFGFHAARNHPWDVAAGYLLVERAGGVVVDFEGRSVSIWDRVPTLAGAPQVVDEALAILSGS